MNQLTKISMLTVLVIACVGVLLSDAQEELMDGINFNTTQVMVRLSGPWDNNEQASAHPYLIDNNGADIQINTNDADADLFGGNSDWRENRPAMVVDAGQYIWAHVFLNIRSPQTEQVNQSETTFHIPIRYNLGNGRALEIIELSDNPAPNQYFVGPSSGYGYAPFPGTVTIPPPILPTVFNIEVTRTNNLNSGLYHIISVKFHIRNIVEGGANTRVEITPDFWDLPPNVDQPDRIADAIRKTPAPQYIFRPDIKRHLVELTEIHTQTNLEGGTVTITKSTVISSQFLSEHLGWKSNHPDGPIPASLYPFLSWFSVKWRIRRPELDSQGCNI